MSCHKHPDGKFSAYLIEDYLGHEIYYGQTSLTLDHRMRCHHSRLMAWSHSNSALQRVHDKDGDCLFIHLIAEFDTRAEALAHEKALIKANPNCLNNQHRRAKREAKRLEGQP